MSKGSNSFAAGARLMFLSVLLAVLGFASIAQYADTPSDSSDAVRAEKIADDFKPDLQREKSPSTSPSVVLAAQPRARTTPLPMLSVAIPRQPFIHCARSRAPPTALAA